MTTLGSEYKVIPIENYFTEILKKHLNSEGYKIVKKSTDNFDVMISGEIKIETGYKTPAKLIDILTGGFSYILETLDGTREPPDTWYYYGKMEATINYSKNDKIITTKYNKKVKKKNCRKSEVINLLLQEISSKIIKNLKILTNQSSGFCLRQNR